MLKMCVRVYMCVYCVYINLWCVGVCTHSAMKRRSYVYVYVHEFVRALILRLSLAWNPRKRNGTLSQTWKFSYATDHMILTEAAGSNLFLVAGNEVDKTHVMTPLSLWDGLLLSLQCLNSLHDVLFRLLQQFKVLLHRFAEWPLQDTDVIQRLSFL